MSPLNVYRASAGSGKTYALTLEYLRLLFLYPSVHRHILAVTFTNKAAGEMKQRILSLLNELSGDGYPADGVEMADLINKTGLNREQITRKSAELLDIILNDYSGFSVGTIDKFFQSVIRAFTREIGIQPGYNLEIDHHRILSLSVDMLFKDISGDSGLQQWLIRYAEERMEESRSWNFRNDIVQLGTQLFREAFQSLYMNSDLSILGKENMDLFLEDLLRIEKVAREELEHIGKKALKHLDENGFQINDFKLKENSPAALFRDASELRDLNFTSSKLEARLVIEKWLNKSATEEMTMLTERILMPLFNNLYEQQIILNTIGSIRKNFYTLGILGDILDRVTAYTKERNLFLIADTSRFLRGIIGGNQVPFVYERTGSRFNHIMLDEFQDTSAFQYDNFMPLLDNSLASGYENLVVGDVKQSIYRWRNSDWNILATSLESDFKHQVFKTFTLKKNFRSREDIIRFNNTIFQLAPETLARKIEQELPEGDDENISARLLVKRFRESYRDAVQQIPERSKGSGGMVRIEFFEEEDGSSFREQALSRIPGWIDEIQECGIELGEIAILVRSRREGVSVAATLLEDARKQGVKNKYRIISNESLLLNHNQSISLLISALRFMVNPEDDLNTAHLKYNCSLLGIIPCKDKGELFDSHLPIEQKLPRAFLERIPHLRHLPLFELVETLIKLFDLDQHINDLPYLQAFQDLVIDLHRREPLGLADFLDFWDQHGWKQGVSVSEEINAIRIITIHKAKGLEFKAVIVPFCNWEITTDQKKPNILWCETDQTPFKRIPVVPVRFSGNMQHTLFTAAYYRERILGYMDSLNLLYVAFTRSKDALFIGVPDSQKKELNHSGDLLRILLDQKPSLKPSLHSLDEYRKGEVLQVGSLPEYRRKDRKPDLWKFTSYPVNKSNVNLKVRLRNDEYFVDEEGIYSSELMYGNMMHQVFSCIYTPSDVAPLLKSMQKNGLIRGTERESLHKEIVKMISQSNVKQWFIEKENRTIYNERTILCSDGRMIRPDRVIVEEGSVTVVDFKFGMVESERYKSQVKDYMFQLSQMGYGKTRGYVWYVLLGKTIKV